MNTSCWLGTLRAAAMDVMAAAAPPNPELAGEWQLTAAGQTVTLLFDGHGGGRYGDYAMRYRALGPHLWIEIDGKAFQWKFEVRGDQLLVQVDGTAGVLILERARRAGRSRSRAKAGRGANPGTSHRTSPGVNPHELCGTWTFYDSASAYNGGHSSSDVSFTLNRDGSYSYGSERSMSAYAYGQGIHTNGSDSDAGQWSIDGDFLVAHSFTRGVQRFRLTRANSRKTGEAMLCLDGKCFVTQTVRPPW